MTIQTIISALIFWNWVIGGLACAYIVMNQDTYRENWITITLISIVFGFYGFVLYMMPV
jgi:hypothetical protein